MTELDLPLPENRKFYFASDFHLGTPDQASSREREIRIVRWLDASAKDAAAIFLAGDLFDFWFEYQKAVPKGFTRFLGKLSALGDNGIPVHIFTGNHDMWMSGYLEAECGAKVHFNPIVVRTQNHRLLVGHGDGLGPGDRAYKRLKKVFTSPLARFFYRWLHPDIGIALALRWSRSSRLANNAREEKFLGEDKEFLLAWCKEQEQQKHHDYYIFGHRHLPLDIEAGPSSRYINLGEWVHFSTYAEYDGKRLELKSFNN